MPNVSAQRPTVKLGQASTGRTVAPNIVAAIGLSLLALVFVAPTARADCTSELRKVTLDKKLVVPLRSYRCKIGTGQEAREFRIEFDRFSDVATSLITSNVSSKLLKSTFGSMTVFQNEISKTYRDLLQQFGTTKDALKQQETVARLTINPAEQNASPDEQADTEDTVDQAKLRFFDIEGVDYPADSEIAALRRKTIPDDLNYYFAIDVDFCRDNKDFVCKMLGKTPVEMVFWRSISAIDVTNFAKNVQSYNSQLMKVRKDLAAAKEDRMSAVLPRYFSLMKYVAGENWPEDLVLMTGQHEAVGCGTGSDLPGVAGWEFSVHPRAVAMDAMVIENMSSQGIATESLFGSRSATNSLRVAKETSISSETTAVGTPSQTLMPGKRLLVPMKLLLLAPEELVDARSKAEKSLADVRAHLGLSGFSGRADALRVPQLNDYAYGPSISIRGLEVNSGRVDVEPITTPNFVALTITAEAGSCPYLLSRSDDGDEWIAHGKILHNASSRERQYSDTMTFKGSRMNFRIEEREPEVAHIENVSLVTRLKDGTELPLRPRLTLAGRSVAFPLDLMWGEAAEVDFTLPDDVASSAVVESRISFTGYYERYAALLAETLSPPELDLRADNLTSAQRRQRPENACFGKARLQ